MMRVIVVVVYEGDGGHTFSQWILSAASSSSSSAQSAARAAEDAAIKQEQAMRMDSGSQSQRQGKARLRQRRRNKTHTHTHRPNLADGITLLVFAWRLSHKATVVEAELQYRYLPLSFGNHRERETQLQATSARRPGCLPGSHRRRTRSPPQLQLIAAASVRTYVFCDQQSTTFCAALQPQRGGEGRPAAASASAMRAVTAVRRATAPGAPFLVASSC